MSNIDLTECIMHRAKIEQVSRELREMRQDLKTMKSELWQALAELRESIIGNGRDGLKLQVDRNTNFRRNLTRLLWALFPPLYSALIFLLLQEILGK